MPSFVTTLEANNNSTYPASVLDGDLVIIAVTVNGGSSTPPTVPSPWTRHYFYYTGTSSPWCTFALYSRTMTLADEGTTWDINIGGNHQLIAYRDSLIRTTDRDISTSNIANLADLAVNAGEIDVAILSVANATGGSILGPTTGTWNERKAGTGAFESGVWDRDFDTTTTTGTTDLEFARSDGNLAGYRLLLETANTPPNAPTLVAPADAGEVYLRGEVDFDWTFSDPDSGDTQSEYALRRKQLP